MKIMSYPNRERVLKKYGMKRFEKTVRYRELFLEEGAQVYVMGEVHGKDNGQPLFKVHEKELYVSDNSKDELLELTNKFSYSIVVMIPPPLGLLLFWMMEWGDFNYSGASLI